MKKFKLVIIISAILIIIGIGLTFYESQLINWNVINQQQNLLPGGSMTLTKDLFDSSMDQGVYSIQITDFQEDDNIKVTIFNPADEIIASKPITKNLLQENFLISTSGTYKIQIENQGPREVQVLLVIGNYPQNISLIDILGFIILITGLS
ncbi:MAG: hypothetical protein HY222_05655 [Thaumarchaeota archaeon]|nr:hypothetical protein [Nitrososphaerota archaeon]MBI3641862.1 hypothetical protein [Nitrososphaerota archaeon]